MTTSMSVIANSAGQDGSVTTEQYERRIRYLGISLEKGTERVPDDGRYYVLRGAEVYHKTASLTIAEAHLELLEDEVKAAHPELKNPRDVIAKEQGFSDILSVRGEARARARTQQEAKGGKGGRSGV